MGLTLFKAGKLFGKKDAQILSIGRRCSARPPSSARFAFGEIVTTIPTNGRMSVIAEYKNISLTVVDAGKGQDKIRPLWRHQAFHA